MGTQFRSENVKGRDLLEERNRWEDNIKIVLNIYGWKIWIGFMWLNILYIVSCGDGNEPISAVKFGDALWNRASMRLVLG
jgi:hypothetical protein